jgi:hypothetical protein
MTRLVVFVVIAPLTILAASCGSESRESERPPEVTSSVQTQKAGSDGSVECPFPTILPTYLPWLQAGEEVPAPYKDRFEAGEAHLAWVPDGKHRALVTLRRYTGERGGPGGAVPVTYDGAEGFLYVGEGAESANIAYVAIVWHHRDGPCNMTALALDAPQLSLDEGKEEIRKIAESLTPN